MTKKLFIFIIAGFLSLALLWLGEAMSTVAACGVAGVAIGVFFIAGGPGLWAKAHDPLQRARVRAGIGWGAATGASSRAGLWS